jgi:hypothetical protein
MEQAEQRNDPGNRSEQIERKGAPESSEKRLERTERWFVSQGLPHFIDDYSATHDIFTRAVPLLTLIFLFEVFGALNLEWVWWANLAAVLGGIAILIAGWALANRARGRPTLARPESVGPVEIAVFVIAPAVLPAVFGGQVVFAASTAGANLLLLGLIYVGTSYGVIPMFKWAVGRLFRQFGGLFDLFVRTLPLLLLFVVLLFITAEVWQVAAALEGGSLWGVLVLFVAAGTLFLIARLPQELGRLSSFESKSEVVMLTKETPVEGGVDVLDSSLETPKLGRREWVNVGLVTLFSQGVQILLVSLLIALFCVGFGLLALTPEIIESWSGGPANAVAQFSIGNREIVLTEELLSVSALLASLSGFYFTVSAITDETYRKEFYEDIVKDIRRSFAVRQVYHALLSTKKRDDVAA